MRQNSLNLISIFFYATAKNDKWLYFKLILDYLQNENREANKDRETVQISGCFTTFSLKILAKENTKRSYPRFYFFFYSPIWQLFLNLR